MDDLDIRCTLVIVHILLVFVEVDHLADNWFCDLVKRCQSKWCNGDVNIAQLSYYWLQLGVINTIEWLDNLEIVLLLLVF